jgi:glycosyltransferase involved in cell wall biosynthesis
VVGAGFGREALPRRPDVVQTWMYHSDLLGGIAARIAGVRHIVWGVRTAAVRAEDGIPRATAAVRGVCARLSPHLPERIVYVAHCARRVHEQLGYDAGKALVIPNGYELPAVARGRLRVELGIPEETLIVGSVGRFSVSKSPGQFVKMAERLSSRSIAQPSFVMVGRGYTWENDELVGWIRTTGRDAHFYLLGERQDVAACLAGMDIFCLHSAAEGFPNVVAEAMSVGTPCVVTDVGDAALLVDGTGSVVPPAQPNALAAAIAEMATLGPEGRRRLGEAARERIASYFSMQTVAGLYSQLYDSLVPVPADSRRSEDVAAVG